MMAKQGMLILLAGMILMAGCAGRDAQPVLVYQPGDENRSCEELSRRGGTIQEHIVTKKKEVKHKQTMNVVWIIGGVLILVPFFFMDLKGAEEAELEALKQRYARLRTIAVDKGCSWATGAAN